MRYNSILISEALKQWKEYSFNEPEPNSITSRLIRENDNTLFLQFRMYNLLDHKYLPMHIYVTFENIAWHPGVSEGPIFETDTERNIARSKAIEIHEKCAYCVYQFFSDKFERDEKFNFFLNNCQTVLGFLKETFVYWSLYILFILFVITMNYTYAFLMFIIFATLMYEHLLKRNNKAIEITFCVHIKNPIN